VIPSLSNSHLNAMECMLCILNQLCQPFTCKNDKFKFFHTFNSLPWLLLCHTITRITLFTSVSRLAQIAPKPSYFSRYLSFISDHPANRIFCHHIKLLHYIAFYNYAIITLRAKLSSADCAVYCSRSCLFVCLFVGLYVCWSVTAITRNCVHRSSPNLVYR